MGQVNSKRIAIWLRLQGKRCANWKSESIQVGRWPAGTDHCQRPAREPEGSAA